MKHGEFMPEYRRRSQKMLDAHRRDAEEGDEEAEAHLAIATGMADMVARRLRDNPAENPKVAASMALSHASAFMMGPLLDHERGEVGDIEVSLASTMEIVALAGCLLLEQTSDRKGEVA